MTFFAPLMSCRFSKKRFSCCSNNSRAFTDLLKPFTFLFACSKPFFSACLQSPMEMNKITEPFRKYSKDFAFHNPKQRAYKNCLSSSVFVVITKQFGQGSVNGFPLFFPLERMKKWGSLVADFGQ